MPSVHLRSCTFAHTVATTVVDDVDLDLADTWIGVVGANGAGKSTLLRLVTGGLTPTSGTVDVVAAVPPVLCHQDVGLLSDDIQAFAWEWSGDAARLRSRLRLDPDDLDRWPTLSPGERKRWQIATALAARPDVLLLDEPTNHLDADARDLLLGALREFDGLGIVVSHDRALLDELTTATVRLAGVGATLWSGAYTAARQRWLEAEEQVREAHARARREERRMRQVLADVRRDRAGAEHAPRAARRNHPDQPDLREAGRKFAQQKAEQALANRVRQLNARVDRAVAAVDAVEVARGHGGAVSVAHATTGRRWVAALTVNVLHAGTRPVLRDVDVAVARGEHVHVAGPNGAGKTTLINALLGGCDDAAALPQDLDAAEARQVLDDVRATEPALRGRILGIVATLGVDPDRLVVSDQPSPGEARKLALARLLAEPRSLVVMDEPTNHLDLPSIERLEDALADYPGALLLVTHDPRLAAAATTTRWEVRDGAVRVVRRPGAPP